MNIRKNITAYFYVYKIRIQKSLAYHYDVYGNILMQCIIMFAAAFFWRALYAGETMVQGVEAEQMYIYTVVSTAMSVFFMNDVEQRVMRSVEKGTIAVEMLKPINLYGIFFFEDLGKLTALCFQNLLPIVLIGSIFIAVPKPANMTAFLLFVAISTVHEYDFFKFASTTIGTVIFMLLIVFILFLFTTLLYQVFGFIGDLYNEIIFR